MTARRFVGDPHGFPLHIHQTPVPADSRGGQGRDGSNTSPGSLTVTAYLDSQLKPFRRIRDLEALANQLAETPLEEVLADLRAVLVARPLSEGDHQRLHVLLSQIHHRRPQFDTTQGAALRAEVTTAWELCRSSAVIQTIRKGP